jgi:hypothetical protein
MAQGTRGRWVRVAAAGLGVLVCGGLGGCMNADKDKKDKAVVKQPATPGLPGTPLVGANGTAGRPGTPPPYTPGGGIQPAGGVGQPRVGSPSGGQNTLNTTAPQPNFAGYPNVARAAGSPLGAPANPNPAFVRPSGRRPTAPGGLHRSNTNPGPAPGAGTGAHGRERLAAAGPRSRPGFDPLPAPHRARRLRPRSRCSRRLPTPLGPGRPRSAPDGHDRRGSGQ